MRAHTHVRASHCHASQQLHTSPPLALIPQGPVRGLDTGCGANLKHRLLGAATYGWHMVDDGITDIAIVSTHDTIMNHYLASL